ncbi:hypothetical protein [Silvibacterium dinghuense]|uniref:Uncharacterized protein n=1 Tax=Silvibacterium dinghuense TaxID=1560006 RepID=A0A4Q1SJD1_9BACT|nr:hypothetical protein [Silvibacterium dinghuense]RXS97754.1 hypothetical protein ESZ00_07795 [Silvibacterium dinghuense]GGH01756.1 hypothetical protein GCM10011586_16790 [Silvibacterium dinghuense]
MKLTIDNHDGNGSVDYSSTVVTDAKFRIERPWNAPCLCGFTLAPAAMGLPVPTRNGRVIVSDDSGALLFTGYVATEPMFTLAGQASAGAVYQTTVLAVSDEILLDRQPIPQSLPGYAQEANELLRAMLASSATSGLSFTGLAGSTLVNEFQADPGQSWAQNAGTLASMMRSVYRVLDGEISLLPVGSTVHTLSDADGTLNPAMLESSMVKGVANDVTVCGPSEPCAYVTELFEGDGTTVLFNLTELPYIPPASKTKPLVELFQEPSIDTQVWAINDSGSRLSLTADGLTCTGGDGFLGDTVLSLVNQLEIGGSLVLEAGGVQFGVITSGILNGIYGGSFTLADCVAGFQISQSGGGTSIAPVVYGTASGSSFTTTAGHMYTLRLRIYSNEQQRLLQSYISADDSGTHTYGGTYITAAASLLFEVQDTTGGVAQTPVVLYEGALTAAPSTCSMAVLNSASLECSVASMNITLQGPVWVESTPPGGSAIVRRIGTTAQGADCTIERTGRLHFYATSVPAAGELIGISYRTTHRSVARLASATSIATESAGGLLPGTAVWIGTVTSPAPRSSVDCENAATAILDLGTSRGAAWKGTYTGWNFETQGDIWPGDLLALTVAAADLTANVVVRSVVLDIENSVPELVKYAISFANDWADALAIKSSATVPTTVWLPQQPQTVEPLANLSGLTVTSVTGSAIAVSTNTTPPAGGGFEVRRRDWSFGPVTNSDLVLRSPVANFTIPREAVMEQYYIRMYDGSTPPNYSRFSSAVFVNVAL